ncbi:FxLYD domain-containing protein [Halomicroarcula sp. F28]|uniref:FxLYD domain-containing protein n=1 Tax=Haloarcula salinisoli TaxID=2487746 RepID=UPI001C73C58A|nr:FxLYD domain-containing protein [Halomicroarcula salinisoli]MBX0288442.1 FxLYD domain-containing protein [Halomicroarcula salinisoli]
MNKSINRRKILSSIGSGSVIALAGCMNQSSSPEENSTSDENGTPEENSPPDENNTEDGEEEPSGDNSSQEFELRTLGLSADSLDSVVLSGEVVGYNEGDDVSVYVQIKTNEDDEWRPTGDRFLRQAERITESREFSRELRGSIKGGIEYQYRSIADVNGEILYGETQSFTVQDLGIASAEIEFGEPELTEEDTEAEMVAVVKVPVENVSEFDSGRIGGVVRWFDDQNTYLGDSSGSLYTLRAGESGYLRVSSYADGINQDRISDFELTTDYNITLPESEGIDVLNSTMDLNGYPWTVSGRATYERSDAPNRVEGIARFYDNSGRVLGDVTDTQDTSNVPEGSNWEFEIRILQGDIDMARESDDYEVMFDI